MRMRLSCVILVTSNTLMINTGIVIAVGMAIRRDGESFTAVYNRADMKMYENKRVLKKKRPSHNLR